jgi:DNA (cytosine-5)-methyltransferase 1
VARKILVADLLCGAGGSSTGCARALNDLGLEMELVCVNHWPIAIETHTKNHPQARHYCQDIATVRPHLLVPEGYLDLLMASPTCTHHSVARGGKPTSDQQRSDPWHIITWMTELRVKRLIIENVWEFTGWGPVDLRTGKPIKARKGEYFRAWIDTIRRLGFDPEWRKLNAADFGDATTRQRFILMARSDARSVSWPIPTHRKINEGSREFELFPTLKPWRPARDIIDWDIKGKSIFNRKKPLVAKTLARIHAGAVKFKWPEPFLVILRNHMAGQSVDQPVPTISAGGLHVGLAQPIMVANRTNNVAKDPAVSPVPCMTTASGGGTMIAEPVIVNGRKGNKAKGVSVDPVPTLDTKGGVWLAEPFVLSSQNSGAPLSAGGPLPTITTGGAGDASHPGCARPILIEPFILNRHGDNGSTRAHSTDEPLPTLTTAKGGEFAIVVPITHAGGYDRVLDVNGDPLPTVTTANRGELAFIAAQFGEREGQAPRVHSIDGPTPAICASGHVNLIEATPQYDILFRMLEPHELAAAMGFDTEEAAYEFAGTKTEQVKQIGNAVSVAKMKACVGSIMADAAKKPGLAADPIQQKRAAQA